MKKADRILIIIIALIFVCCFLADRLYFNRYVIFSTNSNAPTAYRIDKLSGKGIYYIGDSVKNIELPEPRSKPHFIDIDR